MADAEKNPKTCFVIMPITDPDGYADGHFQRVYDHLIKPAAVAAGFEPIRADEVSQTNYIMIDVLKRTINSDMAICDLSTRNPNVLFELGIRQAFNKPVTLIKDLVTPRIFDIQGLRTLDYTETLRIDTAESDRLRLTEAIKNTAAPPKGDVNSLIEILGISPAELPHKIELTERDSLMMASLRDIADRVAGIERQIPYRTVFTPGGFINPGNLDVSKITDFTWAGGAPEVSVDADILSVTERELLHLLESGVTRKHISERLGISDNALGGILRNTYKKLKVGSRIEALRKAKKLGLL